MADVQVKQKLSIYRMVLLLLVTQGVFAQVEVTTMEESCPGMADGSATVSVSGGTAPYTYFWLHSGETSSTVTGLTAGVYEVTVFDANGCMGDGSGEVIVSETNLELDFSSTETACAVANNGTASVSVTNSSGPYTYSWSNGGTTQTIKNLVSGTYSVHVESSAGCKGNGSVYVPVSTELMVATITDEQDVSCYDAGDGSATVSVNMGEGLTYKWWPKGGNGPTASGLDGGAYFVTVTDKYGCTTTNAASIGEPSKLNVSIAGGPIHITFCMQDGDPSVTLHAGASGGIPPYEYSWPGGSLTVSGSGRYTCTVTDANGCTESASALVIFVPIFCSRDPNDITGPEGYGPEAFIAKTDRMPFTIRYENDPVFAVAPAQKVYITLPVDDNLDIFSFRLNEFGFGDFVFEVPENKNFHTQRLDVRDSLGIYVDIVAGIDVTKREAFWRFESIDPATGLPPTGTFTGFLPVNDSITHRGEGFVSYSIKPARQAQTADTTVSTAEIVFDVNESIITNTWKNTIDAKAPVSGLEAMPEFITSPEFQLNFTGQDDEGGSGIATYTLYYSENDGPFMPYKQIRADSSGNTITFSGKGQTAYRFFSIATDNVGNTEEMKSVNEAETFIFTDSLKLSYTKRDLSCNGANDGQINLLLKGGLPPFTYTWSHGDTEQVTANLQEGTYKVVVNDALGFKDSVTVQVNTPDNILFTLGDDISGCIGDTFYINPASTGYDSILWNTGITDKDLRVTQTGQYSAIAYVGHCRVNDTVDVFINTFESTNLDSMEQVACSGDTIILDGGEGNDSYLWSNGSTGRFLKTYTSGKYGVLVQSGNCMMVDSTELTFNPAPGVYLGQDTEITVKESLELNAANENCTYLWSDGSTSETLTVDGAVTGGGEYVYWVRVTNSFNCSASDTIVVKVDDLTSIKYLDEEGSYIKLFPNPSEGIFNLTAENLGGEEFEINIFDMSGKAVFHQSIGDNAGIWSEEVDLTNYDKGIYIIDIKVGVNSVKERLIIY